MPDKARTKQIARDFLQRYAPDLLPRMAIQFIEPHDESIRIPRDGNVATVMLTGMKFKVRNLANGRYC